MLSREQNDLITLTGPGMPGGDMMRRYWHPVALSEELAADVPLQVRILSEDLVLFRGEGGKPNLIGLFCPHRSADLSYGRVENGGLRCIYHGWLMSGAGRCLEQPGEPANSTFKDKIRHTAYPCVEAGGLILTYMGPGDPPRLPQYPFFTCEPEQVWTTKIYHECNYLQASEGNVDPQHLSFLHVSGSAQNSLLPGLNDLLTADVAPKLDVQETPFGYRIFATRRIGPDRNLARITNFIMPNCSAFDGVPIINPKSPEYAENIGYQLHWHVPIDDGAHWKYTIMYRHKGPVDTDFAKNVLFGELDEKYHSPRNAYNRYLQSREEMRGTTFAGLGRNFYDQDLWAVETQGRIMDRSRENLGATDRTVILMRRQLLKAVDDVRKGLQPLFVEQEGDPNALADLAVRNDQLPIDVDVMSEWWRDKERERQERQLEPA